MSTITAVEVGSSCPRCGMASDTQPCARCQVQPPPYDSAASWTSYEGVARELIHLLKYERVLPVARYCAARLSRLAPASDVAVPVPLARKRQRERGFNHAARIAAEVASRLGIDLALRALVRRRETLSQAGLTVEERERNVAGAFGMADARAVRGRRVLLIDDILTTGATARHCALALRRGGASHVSVLTVARADLRFAAAARASSGAGQEQAL